MTYWLWLKKKRGDPYIYQDSLLPGLIPAHVFDLMVCDVVERDLGLCAKCDVQGARGHVVEAGSGRKFCPVLFKDVVKPSWTVSQVC